MCVCENIHICTCNVHVPWLLGSLSRAHSLSLSLCAYIYVSTCLGDGGMYFVFLCPVSIYDYEEWGGGLGLRFRV